MKRVAILGAAGRDCHNFNAVFRSNPTSKVVAFTATQIPDIADLCDPAAVTGERLPPNSEELVLSFKSIPTPKERIDLESQSGAHNYSPLDVVIEHAEGVWVYDVERERYLDRLASYSAVNHCARRSTGLSRESRDRLGLAKSSPSHGGEKTMQMLGASTLPPNPYVDTAWRQRYVLGAMRQPQPLAPWLPKVLER